MSKCAILFLNKRGQLYSLTWMTHKLKNTWKINEFTVQYFTALISLLEGQSFGNAKRLQIIWFNILCCPGLHLHLIPGLFLSCPSRSCSTTHLCHLQILMGDCWTERCMLLKLKLWPAPFYTNTQKVEQEIS